MLTGILDNDTDVDTGSVLTLTAILAQGIHGTAVLS